MHLKTVEPQQACVESQREKRIRSKGWLDVGGMFLFNLENEYICKKEQQRSSSGSEN